MTDPKIYDLPGLEVGEPLDAAGVTSVTLVGYNYKKVDAFPRSQGNCFSVEVPDHGGYRIVNFSHENLSEAVRRGVTWPIKILPIGRNVAVIHDIRIPQDWYDKLWCETCCPTRMLPPPQRLLHLLDIERGFRTETAHSVSCNLKIPRVTLPDPDQAYRDKIKAHAEFVAAEDIATDVAVAIEEDRAIMAKAADLRDATAAAIKCIEKGIAIQCEIDKMGDNTDDEPLDGSPRIWS